MPEQQEYHEERNPDKDNFCGWPRCRKETAIFIRVDQEDGQKRIPLCDEHGDMFLSVDERDVREAYKAMKLKKERIFHRPAMPVVPVAAKPTPEPKLDVDSKIGSLLDRLRAGEFELKNG